MPTDFSSQIADLAASFANALIAAIRTANIEDLRALAVEASAPSRATAPGPSPKRAAKARAEKRPKPPPSKPQGRLHRRSPAEIAKALSKVVALVKESKGGLRSEQIRKKLGMLPKEMPRILKEGLEKRALRSKGEKRSTVYSAA